MIPFEKSGEINKEIFSFIKSKQMLKLYLRKRKILISPDMKPLQEEETHTYSTIAPNANSSMIVSTSPSIEPHKANAYT